MKVSSRLFSGRNQTDVRQSQVQGLVLCPRLNQFWIRMCMNNHIGLPHVLDLLDHSWKEDFVQDTSTLRGTLGIHLNHLLPVSAFNESYGEQGLGLDNFLCNFFKVFIFLEGNRPHCLIVLICSTRKGFIVRLCQYVEK